MVDSLRATETQMLEYWNFAANGVATGHDRLVVAKYGSNYIIPLSLSLPPTWR